MASSTTIEWTDSTWHPVRGCTRYSEGCRNCYAIRFAVRHDLPGRPFDGLTRKTKNGLDWSGKVMFARKHLFDPLSGGSRRMIFVNSVSDLFHERLSTQDIVSIGKVMKSCPWHTFQVLTKRSARLKSLLNNQLRFVASERHILWGVTVENRSALSRIDHLRDASCGRRFLSIEPLLEDLGMVDLTGIDWVIVGGESGPGARPLRKEWAVSLRDQALAAGVPFFFKQWGGTRKKLAGALLDGKEYKQYPDLEVDPMPSRSEKASIRNRLVVELAEFRHAA